MSRVRSGAEPEERYEDSPIAWFGELILSIDKGNYDRAAESQRQLDRLGWDVRRRQPRNEGRRQAVSG